MTCYAIWIDREGAKIFQFSREKMERKILNSYLPDPHTQERRLFKEIVEEISLEGQILILGPGVVKFHFQNFLNEHHPVLSKRVVACETVNHPTDPQIAEQAMKHFKIASPSS